MQKKNTFRNRTGSHGRYPSHSRYEYDTAPQIPHHPLRPQWLYLAPSEINMVFFDLETTGGNPQNASVTEIAAIRYENGVETGRFHTLVNPQRYIPRRVQELTGIRPDDVKDAPPFSDVIGDFLKFVGDAVLVSHGVISDYAFVDHGSREYLGLENKNYYICTHLLVSNFFSQIPNKSLSGVAAHFATPPAEAHRAEADAEMTANIFWAMYNDLEKSGFRHIEDLLKLQADQQTIRRLGAGILAKEIEDKAPTTPGIFYLFNGRREISFLSAAANLKKTLHDTMRLGDEREFNKLLVDARDFKFERTPHFLSALLKEKDHLRKLRLPIDPRKLQGRANGFVQLFISQDILELAAENPAAVPFAVPQEQTRAVTSDDLRRTMEREAVQAGERQSEDPANSFSSDFFDQNYAGSEDEEKQIPVRHAPRLGVVRRLDKYQIDRSGDDELVAHGPLQEGVGWCFGPFDRPKEVANNLREILSQSGISSEKISTNERARRLWRLVQVMTSEEGDTAHKITHLAGSLLTRFVRKILPAQDDGCLPVEDLVMQKHMQFGKKKTPRSGIAVISNPEYKELDIFVVVMGTPKKITRLAPEDSDKVGSSRYFTRLFQPFDKDLRNLGAPIFFTEEKCTDIELFSHWARAHEGEWADFADLQSLYQPE
jgi:DNA polymerase III epsilon subunit family exonuclease